MYCACSVGYVRIVFAIGAFYYMPFNQYVTITLYGLSEIADAFDGWAARSLKQGWQLLLSRFLFGYEVAGQLAGPGRTDLK